MVDIDRSQYPLVFVIILAWNHCEDTLECIRSFTESRYANLHILVVNNASTDNTVEEVRNHFPYVQIISTEHNLGVSGGYNFGLNFAFDKGAEYIIIANNDIIADIGLCGQLVSTMMADASIGIGMPKIFHYYGNRNRLWCVGAHWRRFPPMVKMDGMDKLDSERYSIEKSIQYAPSCCLIIRKSLLEKIGFFDTEYFFYYDDWDYSERCQKSGMTIRYNPNAILWHKVSISTQKSDKPKVWWSYFGKSVFRFYKKYSTTTNLVVFSAWFILREAIKLNFNRILPFVSGLVEASSKDNG